ncbi:hypothetical protein EC3006_5043 [Escherichia coli 3006]|nr:hypothetical protein EC3006_5043 [Escherichia coli 3006]
MISEVMLFAFLHGRGIQIFIKMVSLAGLNASFLISSHKKP